MCNPYRATGSGRFDELVFSVPTDLFIPAGGRPETIDDTNWERMFAEDGSPRQEIGRLLAAGVSVVGADLLYQGEFLADGQVVAAGHPFGIC